MKQVVVEKSLHVAGQHLPARSQLDAGGVYRFMAGSCPSGHLSSGVGERIRGPSVAAIEALG